MSTLYGSASAANNLRMSLLKNLNMISQSQQIMIDESRKYSLMIKDQSSDNIEMFCKRIAIILSNLINSSATLQSRLMAYEELVNKIENRYKNTGSFSNSETNQHWSYNNSHMTFDSPDALSSQLEISQKYGNCGLCSVQNVAAMKGVKLDQDYVFNLARKQGMATKNGGTSCDNRKDLLGFLGIQSELVPATRDNIVKSVMSGRGVIASVDANVLYYGKRKAVVGFHAITVTSVTLDKEGNVVEYIVCDSNAKARQETGAKRYSPEVFEKSLTGRPLNVTEVLR